MDECSTRENMVVDAFQKAPRPAVPQKGPSPYLRPREPETPRSPTVSPKPFPRSPTLPRIPPTPHYMAPQRGNSLGLPSTDDDSSVTSVPPRPVCPPPVPPKTKNSVYLHPNVLTSTDTCDARQTSSPVSLSSTESELRPTSPTALRPPPSPSKQRRSPGPHRTQTQNSEDSGGVESPISPRLACCPPLPPKTKSYVYLTLSDTSDGGQDPSPVSFTSTENELRSTSPTALRPPPSPSEQRRSPGPHRTHEQDFEEIVAVEKSPRSQAPQPPTPAPRTRRIYQTTKDISTCSAEVTQSAPSATHHTPAEDTPLPAQVPRIHVTPQQSDEYNTPSNIQTSTGPTIPPPVPTKTKTRDRPQLTTTTSEQYDRPTLPKPPSRPASYSDKYYQAPISSLDDTTNVHPTGDRDYQAPNSGSPASEAHRDRAVSYLSPPSPVPRDGSSYRSDRSSPSASLQRTPHLKPELYSPHEPVIYEPPPSILLLEPQAVEQLSPRPPPPSFSPPPPPAFSPLNPEYSRAYLQVLPGDSGHQISTHGPVRDSHSPSGTLSRSRSETFLDKEEMEQEQGHLSKWKKTMELLDTAPFSHHSRPITAEEKTKWINQTAQRVRKALTYFQSMLPGRRDTLRYYISELKGIAYKLEKNKKRHRVMGTGAGTTGAVGGVAAVVGIALAPLTMGASLVATAVGAGMAVAAGGMGANSAVKKKKSKSVDQKRVEEIIRAYRDQAIDLENSLAIVRTGMAELRRHTVTGASKEAVWVARVAEAARRYGKADSVKSALSGTDDILKGLDAISEGYYSTIEGEKQKKGSEDKFATKVSTAARQLQEGLDDMNNAWETFSLATASV